MKPLGTLLPIEDILGQEIRSGDVILHMQAKTKWGGEPSIHVVHDVTKGGSPKSICIIDDATSGKEVRAGLADRMSQEDLVEHYPTFRRTAFVRLDPQQFTGQRLSATLRYIQENT